MCRPLKRTLRAFVLVTFLAAAVFADVRIDADFPSGNIVVEKTEGDTVYIHQDLRDTQGDWFYWCFRVRGAAGRTLKFQFTRSDVIGVRGPAVSTDGGVSWKWLGRTGVQAKAFTYTFAADADDARFSMGMPYAEATLKRFLSRYEGRAELKLDTLCRSRKDRAVELLHVGRLDGQAAHRVVFTARHHACEMMANYEMEGIVEGALADDDTGKWLRGNVEFLMVPFVDKDGVEDGDQGKNRKPHDHNRDYMGEAIHPSVAALRKLLPEWSQGRLSIAIDLHCPSLRDQTVQFIGGPDEDNWRRVGQFSAILEKTRQGTLVFRAVDNLPFGKTWNTTPEPRMFARWAQTLPGVQVASTIELPYATAGGKEVNADTARAFGRDIARAVCDYLKEDGPR